MIHVVEMFIYSLSNRIPPGPVNILSASYGKKYGFLNSVSFLYGAAVGSVILTFVLGMGDINSEQDFPKFANLLKYFGGFYMIYIAISMLVHGEETTLESCVEGKFTQGVLIQWVNPKTWAIAALGLSKFGCSNESLLIYLSIEFVIACLGIAIWAFIGEQISKFFSSSWQQKMLNAFLGIALAASAIHTIVG